MGRLANAAKAAATIFVPVGLIMTASAVAGQDAALLVTVAFFGLVGLLLVLASAGRTRAWLRLRGSSATDPGTVNPGPVEVTGTAWPLDSRDTLTPPRADEGAESLVYEHAIQKKRRSSDPDEPDRWKTTTNTSEGVVFAVEGDAGEVVVDPTGADLLLDDSYTAENSARREYVRRLDPGEQVYVAGEAVSATGFDGPTDGRRYGIERPSTRVPEVLRRVYDQPFVVSDTSEEGAQRQLLANGLKIAGLALFYNVLYVGILVGLYQ